MNTRIITNGEVVQDFVYVNKQVFKAFAGPGMELSLLVEPTHGGDVKFELRVFEDGNGSVQVTEGYLAWNGDHQIDFSSGRE